MFNFNNVFDNRAEFELVCKLAGACKPEYKKLISANTKDDFMQVIYNNFDWINAEIQKFEPKFDYVGEFSEGFAKVKLNGKWGYVNTKGDCLVEPKFDWIGRFSEGFARIRLNNTWGYVNTKGDCLVEPKFDDTCDFSEGIALVKLNGKWGYVNTKGEYNETTRYNL